MSDAITNKGEGFSAEVSGELYPTTGIPKESLTVGARITALDFTKGMLVLVMVLYHWLNYFIGPEGFFYRYLSFLPPSFICITGFLVTHVYLPQERFQNTGPARRLLVRGLKIFGILLILNLGARTIISGGFGIWSDGFSLQTITTFLLTGNLPHRKVLAFFILLPIGCLLLVSVLLLVISGGRKRTFLYITAGLLVLLAVGINQFPSGNLELLWIGLLGAILGIIPITSINRVLTYPLVFALLYILQLAAITQWNVLFPLQVSGVLLMLALIYQTGNVLSNQNPISLLLVFLGRYSLFAYIVQIAVLKVLYAIVRSYRLTPLILTVSFLSAVVLVLISVFAVDQARGKVALINAAYKAVFA